MLLDIAIVNFLDDNRLLRGGNCHFLDGIPHGQLDVLHVTGPCHGSGFIWQDIVLMIKIDTTNNCVHMEDGRVHEFPRRWEATLLALLAQCHDSGKQLTSAALDQELACRGQAQLLNRAQRQRLFANIQAFIDGLSDQSMSLTYAPRKATVGPWALQIAAGLKVVVIPKHGDMAEAGEATCGKGPPAIKLLTHTSLPDLRRLLSHLIVAEGFAAEGNYLDASECLRQTFSLPLSRDAKALLQLREAQYQKCQGNFITARKIILALLDSDANNIQDKGLLDFARFYLDRIEYDASPGQSWKGIKSMGYIPESGNFHDFRITPEWHNLRALLARRCLLHLPVEAKCEVLANHELALGHYEAAIYWGISARDWGRVQAYIANLAYHLYCVIPRGLSEPIEVCRWYALVINHEEKLDVGHDSALDFIFLGEFWLDYEHELTRADDLTIQIGNFHPKNEDFYLAAIKRLEECSDLRQIAIAWINYARFVKRRKLTAKMPLAKKALQRLFVLQPTLKASLDADGYALHLADI